MPDPSSPTTAATISGAEAIAAFRECLVQHGVDAPELTVGSDGSLELSTLVAADLAGQPSVLGLCGSSIVEAGLLDLSGEPELAAAVLADLQAFAECMREEGIDGFPDPLPTFTGIGSAFDRDEVPFGHERYAAAYSACSEAMPASAPEP
jgi:hypothetical protein